MSSSGICRDDTAPQNGLTIASTRNNNKEKIITATPSHSQWGSGEGTVLQFQVEKERETSKNFSLAIFSRRWEGETEKG